MSSDSFIPRIVWSEARTSSGCRLVDDTATRQAGAQLAQALVQWRAQSAENGLLITLSGDLGAGKTTFTQGFMKSLGVEGRVRSPTFTLVETYNVASALPHSQAATANHFDCYRFSGPEEWFEAGFDELIANAAVSLVEWPEKADHCLPPPDIALTLDVVSFPPDSPEPDQRRLRANAATARGQQWLNLLTTTPPR
jgi:tRNA threonylcarbamoyladenosine biosynthesis protein TsaE